MENKKLYKYAKFCEGREAKEGRHLILFSKNKCPKQNKDINIIKVPTGPDEKWHADLIRITDCYRTSSYMRFGRELITYCSLPPDLPTISLCLREPFGQG